MCTIAGNDNDDCLQSLHIADRQTNLFEKKNDFRFFSFVLHRVFSRMQKRRIAK